MAQGPIGQTCLGLLIGMPLALAAGHSLATQLYGVGSRDPIVFGTAAMVLLASTVVAAIIPALRAASISPTRALRE